MSGCNECTCQCANQAELIEKMAAHYKRPVAIMDQATYEAITGNVLEINGVRVEITKNLKDRQFLVTGEN